MGIPEIILIGIGLSMDACAVRMTNAMVYGQSSPKKVLAMPFFFGAFQAIMPIIGYFAGSFFADFMAKYSGIVVMLILGVLGAKMIYEGFSKHDEQKKSSVGYATILTQSVVTSIDAFAVGVGFAAVQTDIVLASVLIGIITLAITLCSVFIGKKFGNMLGSKAEVLGGLILIAIGIKELFL